MSCVALSKLDIEAIISMVGSSPKYTADFREKVLQHLREELKWLSTQEQ